MGVTMTSIAHDIDAKGLRCPEPVMLLHAGIRRAAEGDVIRLCATDPSTRRDVANFCRFLGHELVEQTEADGEFLFVIRKA